MLINDVPNISYKSLLELKINLISINQNYECFNRIKQKKLTPEFKLKTPLRDVFQYIFILRRVL